MHQGPAIDSGCLSRRTDRSGHFESPPGTPCRTREDSRVREWGKAPDCRGTEGRRDPDLPASAYLCPPGTGACPGPGGLSARQGRRQAQPGRRSRTATRPFPGHDHFGRISPLPADAMLNDQLASPVAPARSVMRQALGSVPAAGEPETAKYGNNQVVGVRRQSRTGGGLSGSTRTEAAGRPRVDWQNLMRQLTPLRRRWDLAVLSNLAAEGDGTRPADLIKTINAQARDGRQISWGVLEIRLRRLEASGYISRQEMSNRPRETRYWLLPLANRLIAALTLLETWLNQHEPGNGPCPRLPIGREQR